MAKKPADKAAAKEEPKKSAKKPAAAAAKPAAKAKPEKAPAKPAAKGGKAEKAPAKPAKAPVKAEKPAASKPAKVEKTEKSAKPAVKKAAAKPAAAGKDKKAPAKKPHSPREDEDEDEAVVAVAGGAEEQEEGAEAPAEELDEDGLPVDVPDDLDDLGAGDVDIDDIDDIADVEDVDVAEEEIDETLTATTGLDIDLDDDEETGALGGGFKGEKKTELMAVRKSVSSKKPKIIVVAASPAKKGLKLAPGLLLSASKPAPAGHAPCGCNAEAAKKELRKLTKKELSQIKDKLLLMREDLLEGMRKELADTRQRSASAPADIIDQAADAYDDDISFEIAAANDEELEQIEAALERIDEGTYGCCEICNVPISPTRLKILPFATRCVACRDNYEKTRQRKDSSAWNFFSEEEEESESEEE